MYGFRDEHSSHLRVYGLGLTASPHQLVTSWSHGAPAKHQSRSRLLFLQLLPLPPPSRHCARGRTVWNAGELASQSPGSAYSHQRFGNSPTCAHIFAYLAGRHTGSGMGQGSWLLRRLVLPALPCTCGRSAGNPAST
ncbi:hypothetical protein NMY22_g7627 [Coprinellus aureogranulatus]|nr:hypothetical protein NMY22_g7627 [Coprinellus aureogranulatus]